MRYLVGLLGVFVLLTFTSSCSDVIPPPGCDVTDCDDGNDCTADECEHLANLTAKCTNLPKDDDTLCTEGGMDGRCVSGKCEACMVSCDDGNECTDDGVCDPSTGACPDTAPEPPGTPCGDGGVCDGAGACVNCSDASHCDDENPCTSDVCTSSGTCSNPNADGTTCELMSGSGRCSGGECRDPMDPCFVPNLCDDDEQCTQDMCQALGEGPNDYECSHPPLVPDSPCSQDGGQYCDGSGNCVACNSPGQCDDSDQCTQDACLGNACAHTASSANTPCNQDGGSFCDGIGNCVECNRSEQCPDDGEDCTSPLCDTQTCGTENDTGTCDFNGGLGVCQAGVCVDGNKCNVDPYPCEDRGPCVDDVCDPATGLCSYSNSSNGKSCTIGSYGGECLDGLCNLCVAITCDDNDPCTEDGVCNLSTGNCDGAGFESINTPCGDGVCDGAGQCVDCNNDTQCNDGVQCTDDRCLNNSCSNDPSAVDSSCSVGGTYCDGGGNCVQCNQSAQCPDDGNVCTAPVCNTHSCASDDLDSGECVFMEDQVGVCSEGECIDAFKCDPYICEDRGQCVDDSCNPVNGVCSYVNAPSSRSCTVGQYSGQCSNGLCDLCATVVCDDGNPCKIFGTCNASNGQCEPPPQNKADGTDCGGAGQACASGACANDPSLSQYYNAQGPFDLDFAANYMWGLQGFYLNFLGSGVDHNINKALAGFFHYTGKSTLWVRLEDQNADDAYSWSLHTRKLPIGSSLGWHSGTSGGSRIYELIGPLPADKVPVLLGFYVYRAPGTDANLQNIAINLYADRVNSQVGFEVKFHDDSPGENFSYQVSYGMVPSHRVTYYGTKSGSVSSGGEVQGGVPSALNPLLQGFDLRFSNGDHNIDQISAQMLVPNQFRIRFNDRNNDDPFTYEIRWVDLE